MAGGHNGQLQSAIGGVALIASGHRRESGFGINIFAGGSAWFQLRSRVITQLVANFIKVRIAKIWGIDKGAAVNGTSIFLAYCQAAGSISLPRRHGIFWLQRGVQPRPVAKLRRLRFLA